MRERSQANPWPAGPPESSTSLRCLSLLPWVGSWISNHITFCLSRSVCNSFPAVGTLSFLWGLMAPSWLGTPDLAESEGPWKVSVFGFCCQWRQEVHLRSCTSGWTELSSKQDCRGPKFSSSGWSVRARSCTRTHTTQAYADSGLKSVVI